MSPSLPQQPGNLPHPLGRLIGRSEELARLKEAARKTRLVSLIGPAGVGKTRLAIEYAGSMREPPEGGAWFVDLSGVTSPSIVAQSVADVLHVEVGPQVATRDALVAFIGARDLLLVLDNCEHLLEAAEEIAHALLGGCPRLHLVATSREALRVVGGLRWPVQPLDLPDQAQTRPRAIARSSAVQLFATHAVLANPDFEVNLSNAETVGEICRRLDGIPLALELCASRVRMMPLDEILERLGSRFDLLTDGSRVAAARQRTLRATIDWSYELLDDSERAMFRRLGVFVGGFDLHAADGVTSGGPVAAGVLSLLTRLVDKSLVQAGPPVQGRARYRLLDSVREYALERLADNAEAEIVGRRHAQHYLERAEQAAVHLRRLAAVEWLDRLTAESGNFRAALDWSLATDHQLFVSLTLALSDFWSIRGHTQDSAMRLPDALQWETGRTAARRRLLAHLGTLAWRRGDYPTARRHLEESVAIARETGDEEGLAKALGTLGFVLFGGDHSEADGFFQEQLEIASRLQNDELVADALSNAAIHALHEVDGPKAAAATERCIATWRRLGDHWLLGIDLGLRGLALIVSGDLEGAEASLAEGIRIRASTSDSGKVGTIVDFAAELNARRGKFERATLLAGMADAMYARVGVLPPSLAVASRQRWIDGVRSRLGKRVDTLLKEGAAFTFEDAVAFALDPEHSSEPYRREPRGDGLSARELEIARLVADGLTNREVAARLGVAVRTIDSHLEHVRTKLGVGSRAEIAQWVASRSIETTPSYPR